MFNDNREVMVEELQKLKTQLLVPKPAAGGESTRNPSDLPAGNAVTRATGLSSLVMISVATLLLWW
ncbi:hypothetical protein F2Q70_00033563 [Brassica cretica]|uniref:Uncharacterized protein n=2 Tax=Brassica cretica TaxID=69181 RepID=A0A8S9FIY5_BRACR|nr:hypothetical protein F2Q70_00033563 [Brassica cretica]KAF2551901.1 hypothetical protein F2Q68_00037980 [Brassica cretica]KAF3593961.1 hypothetical protein DY000_02028050 [Brassica cretica]